MSGKIQGVKQANEAATKQRTSMPARQEPTTLTEQVSPSVVQQAFSDPRSILPRDVLALQRMAGNRAVNGLIQARLMVGPAGDHYEQEADRVAEQVMTSQPASAPANPQSVRRQEDEEEIQTFAMQRQPLAASITPLIRRQEDEEEIQTVPLLQRQEDEEEIQTAPLLQRQEDEEEIQTAPLLQRQEDEEEIQTAPLLQRQEDEEEIQTSPLLQRQEDEEEVQTYPLVQRQEDEEEVQTSPLLQRQEDEEEIQTSPLLQRAGDKGFPAGGRLESALSSSRGGGSPLSGGTRHLMESRFGADFSGVRVHTGSQAAQLNQTIQAQAFTYGQDIYMGAGRFAPDTTAGQRLLAHELTHTIQQGASPVHPRRKPAAARRSPVSVRAASPIASGVLQMKKALVNDKAHTRVVATAVDRTKPAAAQVKQVEKGKYGTVHNKMDEVQVDDDDSKHINDASGAPAWLLINGTTNEYIRASKVFELGYKPTKGGMEGLTELKSQMGQVEAQEGDIETESEEYEVGEQLQEGMEIPSDVLEDLNKEEKEEEGLIKSEEKSPGMTYAQSSIGIASGMLGFALGAKKLFAAESSVEDRIEAIFDMLGAGADIGGGISKIVSTAQGAKEELASTKAAGFFDSFSGIVKTVWSGIQTIKNVVEIIKMVTSDEKYAAGEYVEKGSEIIKNALDTASGVVSTVKSFYELFAGGVPVGLATAIPGLDIAISAVSGIMKGYYLAVSTYRWYQMKKSRDQLKAGLKADPRYQKTVNGQQAFSKETFAEIRKFYAHQEAVIATNQKLSKEKDDQIKKLQDKKAKITGTDAKSVQKKQALDAQITAAQTQKTRYDGNIAAARTAIGDKESEKIGRKDIPFYTQQEAIISTNQRQIQDTDLQITQFEEAKNKLPKDAKGTRARKILDVEINAAQQQRAQHQKNIDDAKKAIKDKETAEMVGQKAHLSRADLAEFEMVSELKSANRKRIVRQAIHITTEILKIAGAIANLASASGYALAASVGLKASAAGIELSLPFFRAIKQWGRNVAAKNTAQGTTGLSNKIFNEDKATAAKLQARKKHALVILTMAANLPAPTANPTTEKTLYDTQKKAFDTQASRVERYISATGCWPAKLYRANGNPLKQVQILAKEMAKREFLE